MIDRYDCAEITDIWTDYNKFKVYLDVELALLRSLEGKVIPEDITYMIKERSKINVKRINEIEEAVHHDVIAFCSSITENLPPDIGKYFHFGCTSSDIIDTSISIMIKQSLELIIKKLELVLRLLKEKSISTKYTIGMGRSHGRFAEPMSFGLKFLSSYSEFYRRYLELKDYMENDLTGQLSGTVGNYTILNTEIEKEAIESLGLKVEPISTQIIPRDRFGKLIHINSLLACAIERIALELRLLHHSDIEETLEGFGKSQKGSSAMPHKKNPISSENLTGIARVLKSHVQISQENIPLWHERDLTHSSAERMYLPDNLGLVFYALKRLGNVLSNLVIDKENIERKVFQNFNYLSSYLLHKLLNCVDINRDEVYSDVQKASFESKNLTEFLNKLKNNKRYSHLKNEEFFLIEDDYIRKIYTKEVNQVYERVFKDYPV